MNEILMCGTDPVGQLYKDTKAEATSIAPIEVSPTESSHNVGTHIMYGGIRYKVTSSISVGDTLTIGENITAENVESNIVYPNGVSVKDKIDDITELYKTENIFEPSFTVNSLTYVDKSILIPAKSGYKPVGVVRWLLRSAFAVLVKADLSFSNNNYYLDITIGNPTTSEISPFPQFTILYIKDI